MGAACWSAEATRWMAAVRGRDMRALMGLSAKASARLKGERVKRMGLSPVCLAASARWAEGAEALFADGWSVHELMEFESMDGSVEAWSALECALLGSEWGRFGFGKLGSDATAVEMVELLYRAGAGADKLEEPVLLMIVAAVHGDPPALSWMCDRHPHLAKQRGEDGATPLDCALRARNAENAAELIWRFGGEPGEEGRAALAGGRGGEFAQKVMASLARREAEALGKAAGAASAGKPRRGL